MLKTDFLGSSFCPPCFFPLVNDIHLYNSLSIPKQLESWNSWRPSRIRFVILILKNLYMQKDKTLVTKHRPDFCNKCSWWSHGFSNSAWDASLGVWLCGAKASYQGRVLGNGFHVGKVIKLYSCSFLQNRFQCWCLMKK